MTIKVRTFQDLIGKTVKNIDVYYSNHLNQEKGNSNDIFKLKLDDNDIFRIAKDPLKNDEGMILFNKDDIFNAHTENRFEGEVIQRIDQDMNFYKDDLGVCFGQLYEIEFFFESGQSYQISFMIYSLRDENHDPCATFNHFPFDIHEERESYS